MFAYCGIVVEIQPQNCSNFSCLLPFQRQPRASDMIPLQITALLSNGVKVLQVFIHPQYGCVYF